MSRNSKFQGIARRDKKAFLSDQCKEIKGHNRVGKTRDLFKKIVVSKGTFHAKMGKIKGRNGNGTNRSRDIKTRYTQKNYKKILMTQITMMV